MEYNELLLDGRPIGGAMKPPMEGIPAMWSVYFAVDDCDRVAETTKANGGAVMQGPMDIEPGRMAVLADPAGAVFNVIKMSRPVE
jgi:predicted enzyme related to lactoylglutathione lyase